VTVERRYQLVVFVGDELKTYELPLRGDVTLGRAEGNVVRIDDASVSRHHAVLRVGETTLLEDLGGQNGTYVRRRAGGGPESDTENVRRLFRSATDLAVGDNVILGTVSAVLRHSPSAVVSIAGAGDEARHAGGVVVESPLMKQLYREAELAARAKISLLILGETGVGKDVLARTIHECSPRQQAPFMSVNCAALAESLLEAELFGCEKGAFTGAVQARAGLLEAAHPGTVFLDEVGDLPLATQAKLLRVIEDRVVMRLGSTKPRKIDVRFIAATNRDLVEAVDAGAFRRDLYFRLNGMTLTIPPLRERREEIEALARTFLAASERDLDRAPTLELSPETLEALLRYSWPGNVRELRNAIDRATVLCPGARVGLEHLPSVIGRPLAVKPPVPRDQGGVSEERPSFGRHDRRRTVQDANERERIVEALNQCGGNQTRAAEILGVSRRTLVSRLDEFGLRRPRKGASPPADE
jgi:transcriptional regulator with PAS, ATPase and Fis domain